MLHFATPKFDQIGAPQILWGCNLHHSFYKLKDFFLTKGDMQKAIEWIVILRQ